MSFVKHTACPRCRSSDALANYSDGGQHCFSCGYHPRIDGRVFFNKERVNEQNENLSSQQEIPEWFTQHLPHEGTEWAASYGISVPELLKWEVRGSIKPAKMVFPLHDQLGRFHEVVSSVGTGVSTRRSKEDIYLQNIRLEQRPFAYQLRNFPGETQANHQRKFPKYITYGSVSEILPIYHTSESLSSNSRRLVLVEDCLSAMKIARQSDVMPCLTSTLSLTKLKRLAARYDTFLVWLDGNMYDKAQRLARLLSLLGKEARAVYSPLDPKCYEDEQISRVLLTGSL